MSALRITVAHEAPEGVRVDTRAYERSHGIPVNLIGAWGFAPAEAPGQTVWMNGSLTEAIDNLEDGSWVLLP